MTCAHVVNVALKKVQGVETVDVSLNKAMASIRLRQGNSVSVLQLWQLMHEKGYTPKNTTVSIRGELTGTPGRLQIKVSGAKDIIDIVADPKAAAPYSEAGRKIGQTVVIDGLMVPGKDLKVIPPLQITQVKQ